MAFTLEGTDLNIKVADEKTSKTTGVVTNVPLSFAGKSEFLEFLFVELIPVDMIIGSPTIEYLEALLNMGHNFVTITIYGAEVQLGFEYERTRQSEFRQDATDSEDFSSIESDWENLGEGGNESDGDARIVMLTSNVAEMRSEE